MLKVDYYKNSKVIIRSYIDMCFLFRLKSSLENVNINLFILKASLQVLMLYLILSKDRF